MKKIFETGLFILMIMLAFLWIKYDQNFLSQQLLMPAFLLILVIMLIIYFIIVKPKNVMRLSLTISTIFGLIVIALSVVQHIFLEHNFNLYWKKFLVMWVSSSIIPIIVGLMFFKKDKR